MAHYNFHKDLADSAEGVEVVKRVLEGRGLKVEHNSKDLQWSGDLTVTTEEYKGFVEVKFDIRSSSTGNLCFEVYNGWGRPTGILITAAENIAFVMKHETEYVVHMFVAEELRAKIFSPKYCKHTRMVSGGDEGKYKMLLVKEAIAKNWAIWSASVPRA